jgi:hypothetical protein
VISTWNTLSAATPTTADASAIAVGPARAAATGEGVERQRHGELDHVEPAVRVEVAQQRAPLASRKAVSGQRRRIDDAAAGGSARTHHRRPPPRRAAVPRRSTTRRPAPRRTASTAPRTADGRVRRAGGGAARTHARSA